MNDTAPARRPDAGRLVGRPRELGSARRFVSVQRDRAMLRLWRSAPEAVGYLADVVRGRAEFDEGKYKASVQLLSRCLPTVTAQAIQSDTTTITAAVEARADRPVASMTPAVAIEIVERRIAVLKSRIVRGGVVPVDEVPDGD